MAHFPAIILDKSVFQAMSRELTREQSTYFYTVVLPHQAMEVLGDVAKAEGDVRKLKHVQALAKRIKPMDSIVNAHYADCCVNDLFGGGLAPDGRPCVSGQHQVPLDGGGFAGILEEQPEAAALLRWSYGDFSKSEEELAKRYRQQAVGMDLEGMKRRFSSGLEKADSLEELNAIVLLMLRMPENARFFMGMLRDLLKLDGKVRRQWNMSSGRPIVLGLELECPYIFHWLHVYILTHLAILHGHVSTRSSNLIDMEYFFYSPFSWIFVSRDKFHRQLAPFLMWPGHKFVWGDDFIAALREVSDLRAAAVEHERGLVDPPAHSLIRALHKMAGGRFVTAQEHNERAKEFREGPGAERAESIAELFGRHLRTIEADRAKYPKRPSWPIPGKEDGESE